MVELNNIRRAGFDAGITADASGDFIDGHSVSLLKRHLFEVKVITRGSELFKVFCNRLDHGLRAT